MDDLGSSLAALRRLSGRGRAALCNARVPLSLLADGAPEGTSPEADGSVRVDLMLDGPVVAQIAAAGTAVADRIDLAGRQLWPMLVDAHAHLDKAHTLGRAPDSGGTHAGARDATSRDRKAHWRRDDLLARMSFGLGCAEAHGVAAIRTHLDSHEGQAPETWAAFSEMRAAFVGRIALQAVALVPMDAWGGDYGPELADLVAAEHGILGGVTRASGGTHGALEGLDALLDRLFALARERDLDIDLHVDEAAEADALPHVARATIRHGWQGRVTCGHCCSLSLLPEADLDQTIALLAEAQLNLITLPTVNMYLQDRQPGRTPRWRGVMPVAELQAAGLPVAVAGDNCRDPFYAYGDHDMLDTWRQAVRILHLDHPIADAPSLAGPVPARIMGIDAGVIGAGRQADLMLFQAYTLDQVVARPQSDRTLIRAGQWSSRNLPGYRFS
ncbi:cytosine deaminase [Paracoccus aestuarii]|uniref:Cytosine deaminase n=1 Tax=Paracoccus aestuarii TaxID=453842 RepID=A0A418ZVP9_9RHOB|nr:cytosine deaminase [Paracoccus aestuarii]RJL03305.1 cytosine deaminase [Paracoccus aestuarii]WCQ98767.1 cytosine deaminase [Paracoccus aestuarii]